MNGYVKTWIEDLREMERYGDTVLSSYGAGKLADLIEEQDGIIHDLMFENESKQQRIKKLQTELKKG